MEGFNTQIQVTVVNFFSICPFKAKIIDFPYFSHFKNFFYANFSLAVNHSTTHNFHGQFLLEPLIINPKREGFFTHRCIDQAFTSTALLYRGDSNVSVLLIFLL